MQDNLGSDNDVVFVLLGGIGSKFHGRRTSLRTSVIQAPDKAVTPHR